MNKTMDSELSSSHDPRPSCKFASQCYRNNPNHRLEQAHPGDDDYSILRTPSPVVGAPKCKYGRNCYRQNPEHFQNFRHPRIANNSLPRTDDDDSNDEDPFAGDSGGSEYVPSDDED